MRAVCRYVRPCRAVQYTLRGRPKATRWDLPQENPLPGLDAALATVDEERGGPIRLDLISGEDVDRMWPPEQLIKKTPAEADWPHKLRRPDLWVTDETRAGVEDVGRFVKIPRDQLIEDLAEGACGELAKDVTLIPSRTRAVGLMLRKATWELMAQLSECRDATDKAGVPKISKAGFFIDGRKGTGKSQVLNLLAMWARRNGWLVVMEPTPSRYSREIAEIKRSNNGVYIQNEFAQQFLESTSLCNRLMLEEIPVDLSAYGSRAIDGEPVTETRRLYEPLIEKTVDQEVLQESLTPVERLRRIAKYKRQVRLPSMAEQLPDPANVWEIVDFGLQNEAYATQAVAEMFAQLQRQTTHPVLVMVDEWNECFPCSEYVSIRYDNTRFNGYIPAYHLTMPRFFHRWDGHLYRRGLKIYATSWMRYRRRNYDPEMLGIQKSQIRTIRNFSQHEFANYVTYLRMVGVLHNFHCDDLAYYYMLTQGNGWEARRMLSTLF